MTAIMEDALDGLTRKQMLDLEARLQKRLLSCTLCGGEHPARFRVVGSSKDNSRRAQMLICVPCFEKHRLPDTQAEGAG